MSNSFQPSDTPPSAASDPSQPTPASPVRPRCPECKSANIRVDSFDHTNVFCVLCTDCGHVYGVGYGPVESGCPPIPVSVTGADLPLPIQQPVQVRVI